MPPCWKNTFTHLSGKLSCYSIHHSKPRVSSKYNSFPVSFLPWKTATSNLVPLISPVAFCSPSWLQSVSWLRPMWLCSRPSLVEWIFQAWFASHAITCLRVQLCCSCLLPSIRSSCTAAKAWAHVLNWLGLRPDVCSHCHQDVYGTAAARSVLVSVSHFSRKNISARGQSGQFGQLFPGTGTSLRHLLWTFQSICACMLLHR